MRKTLLVLVFALPSSVTEAQSNRRSPVLVVPGFRGAIFTTDSTCTVINANIYDSKLDVYLTGGGRGVKLPNGSYYVKVTEPNGTVLGSSGGTAPIQVVGGKFADCYQVWELVGGFGDSRNNEYKVWVCRDAGFVSCKTDNFRIRERGGPPATRTRTGTPPPTAPRTGTRTRTATLPPGTTATRTPTGPAATATATSTPTAPAATATRTATAAPATATPTGTPSLTPVPPTATATGTPIVGGGTPVATVTATATATPTGTPAAATSTPTSSPTAVGSLPTATPTFGTGPGGPVQNIPTLSFPMLALLGLALGVAGLMMARRL